MGGRLDTVDWKMDLPGDMPVRIFSLKRFVDGKTVDEVAITATIQLGGLPPSCVVSHKILAGK